VGKIIDTLIGSLNHKDTLLGSVQVVTMRWIPPWLAKAYARIYAEKKMGVFEFSEAARILEIEDERPLAKTLAMLRSSGYLTVRRDPADTRRKLFRLVDPESVTLALAIQSKAETTDPLAKLKAASGFLDYYIYGSYAAYQYHRYLSSGKVDLSVKADQMSTWISLLAGKDVALSIDEVPSEKPSTFNIHLHSDFDKKLAQGHIQMIDGIRYLSPEALVAIGLTGEGGSTSLEDILAILLVQRNELDWSKLLALSDAYNATRYLGCILAVLNFESGKPLFNMSLVNKIRRESNLRAKVDFPSKLRAEPQEERYSQIASEWNVRLYVSRAVVSKIITDLIRT